MKLHAPLSICLCITNKCNLSCKHCFVGDRPDAEPDLTRQEMLDLIDEFGKYKVFGTTVFGGEPFTSPYIYEYMDALKKYKIKLGLNTNATLIKRKDAQKLKHEYGVENICVSLDGSSPDIMDKTRGAGSFNRVLRGIKLLISEGHEILLGTTITKLNYMDAENIVKLAKDINAKGVRFNHVFFTGNASCFMKEVYLDLKDEVQILDRVYNLYKKYGNFITGSYLSQRKKLMKLEKFPPKHDKIKVSPCGAGKTRYVIRADGWVVPCEILWNVKVGNVRKQSLREIWFSKGMEEFRKPLTIDLEDMPECKGCKYQYMCFHGHRCWPYYYPNGMEDRKLHCWKRLNEETVLC